MSLDDVTRCPLTVNKLYGSYPWTQRQIHMTGAYNRWHMCYLVLHQKLHG